MRLPIAVALVASLAPPLAAGDPSGKEESPLAALEWRNVGPANMSGRVADVEGVAGDPRVVYVGAASGGVWKTDDGGVTFRPVFDEQTVHSIGDIATAPSNPDVVYVGTGESNARNSVSPGRGVYKSTDGGKTWTLVGLEETRHVSRVLVHPHDPDRVYVGALGHLFGPNPERGVFRSTNGGTSWEKVLYLDDQHGVADMDMSPANPNVLYAALWRFERKPWTHTSGSEKGGVWRSVDGGSTWKKLEKGLPRLLGRIGVKVAPSDPNVVYVIAESDAGTLYRSDDGGDSFRKVTEERDIVSRGLYYTDLRVHPTRPDTVFAVASLLQRSIDGGKSWKRISRSTHIDFHALWIDPRDPDRMWQGQDGGVAVSYDGGERWEPVRNLPLAQFYQVYADTREPFYFLGGGLQDNGAWFGPSRTREPAGILEDDWRMPSFGDAFYMVAHPEDPDLILSESQGGNLFRTDLRTRQQQQVSPQARRNDGGPVAALEHRFNWNSPLVASPHDGSTVYFAGSVVFRSRDFGSSWEAISPDLTTNDPEKQQEAGGPVWRENTTAEYHCTVISFAESPARKGVLWAGTDDGNLQLSQDDGRTWTNVIGNVKGVPAFSPVSHVEPSRTDAGTAWVAFDRHMFDDYAPHVYLTRDFGRTWMAAAGGLPDGAYVHALHQDPRNPGVLYAGTELGLYASRDGGRGWRKLHLKNLPAVPVHDILVHPRDNDLILGTHGRALWIFDDATPLQQLDPAAPLAAGLFAVRPALRFPMRFTRYGIGDKEFRGPNPPYGALVSYVLPESYEPEEGKAEAAESADAKAEPAKVKLEILDAGGKVVRTLQKPGLKRGVNRVAWDLRYEPPTLRKEPDELEREFGGGPAGPHALPGTYTVRLTVAGQSFEQPVEVRVDPLLKSSVADLRAQFEMAARLTALRSRANQALKELDAIGAQLAERRKTAKQLGLALSDETRAAWDAFEKEHGELAAALARPEKQPRWSQGPRLSEQLDGLFQTIDSAFAAPTTAQRAFFGELEAEAGGALERTDRFLDGGVERFNQALGKAGVPGLARAPRAAPGAGSLD